MRVAYVCTDPGIPVFGRKGASVHVQAVLRVLVGRGADVHLLAAQTGGPAPVGLDGVRVHLLPEVGKGSVPVRERQAQQADAAIAAVLAGIDAERPLDLVYERYALWGRTATAWAAGAGVPSVLEVNAPLVAEQVTHRCLHDPAGAQDVAEAAFAAATAVVCVSAEVAAYVRRVSTRPDRVHVVPNGVDVDRITPRPTGRPDAPGGRFTVGFVGTVKPWHGVDVLVDAVASLARGDRSYRLLVVGDGPRLDVIRRQADSAGIADLVELTGSVDPAEITRHLHRMDVAVAPYPDIDGFYFSPLKVYEYLAAGLPTVASRVGQVPEALDGGRLGTLVPPGDAHALADAIAALRFDPQRRAALARAAREAAVIRHTWSAAVDRVLVLAGAPGAAVGVGS